MQLYSKKFSGGRSINWSGTVNDHINVQLFGDAEGFLYVLEKRLSEDEVDMDGNPLTISVPNYDIPDDLAEEILADASMGEVIFGIPSASFVVDEAGEEE